MQPKDDQQFNHHLEILTRLADPRRPFTEARAIKAEAEKCGTKHWLPWFRLTWPSATGRRP